MRTRARAPGAARCSTNPAIAGAAPPANGDRPPLRLPPRFSSEPPIAIGAFAVWIAERYLGVAYRWGGANPSSGFDCSGFVKYVYAQLGIRLPHYAASQFADTAYIAPAQLEPGDLVFFEPHADGPGHVGIYVGTGMFIEALHTGDVVKFEPVTTEANLIGYVGASRPAA
jgi:cell wall-associated NlpC family hydrolase